MQAKLCKEMPVRDGNKPDGSPHYVKQPAGTIIDHPHAYLLVKMGCADPHDEECRAKADMTAEQLAVAKHAHNRLSARIHPDDFKAYDAGKMIGYDPATGKPIPGPNSAKRINSRTRAKRRRHSSK